MLAPIQGPYGIQPFDDNGNLIVKMGSATGTKYETVVFDFINASGYATDGSASGTGSTVSMTAGSPTGGYFWVISIAEAGSTLIDSTFAAFGVLQNNCVEGEYVQVKVIGFTPMLYGSTAPARGATLAVDDTGNDVRVAGDGRKVALSLSTGAGGVAQAWFDGWFYRG